MVRILDNDLLNKVLVYWAPSERFNEEQERIPEDPVEVKCFYNKSNQEAIDNEGVKYTKTLTIYTAIKLDPGGWVWISPYTVADPTGSALADAPAAPSKRNRIRSSMETPDLDNEETLYTSSI